MKIFKSLRLIALTRAVLWIRIRMDPELLPGSGSGIIVPDSDPAKSERADKKKLNSGLFVQ